MAAIKTTFVLLLIAFAVMLCTIGIDATHVGPCDQVCDRIEPERHECCRAHGYGGYSSCSGGQMECD
ncbi:hypothetical protein PYW08_009720 [Mythimna loreyi]|uniref:Uncharacterized protein n=1 Tax=Mythimna loreyi TaxID=667449 RepID=A0ACC2Q6U3_9NEOP|nr:hypothetical protein PYW08_009720 [Mythimna loreyi]